MKIASILVRWVNYLLLPIHLLLFTSVIVNILSTGVHLPMLLMFLLVVGLVIHNFLSAYWVRSSKDNKPLRKSIHQWMIANLIVVGAWMAIVVNLISVILFGNNLDEIKSRLPAIYHPLLEPMLISFGIYFCFLFIHVLACVFLIWRNKKMIVE